MATAAPSSLGLPTRHFDAALRSDSNLSDGVSYEDSSMDDVCSSHEVRFRTVVLFAGGPRMPMIMLQVDTMEVPNPPEVEQDPRFLCAIHNYNGDDDEDEECDEDDSSLSSSVAGDVPALGATPAAFASQARWESLEASWASKDIVVSDIGSPRSHRSVTRKNAPPTAPAKPAAAATGAKKPAAVKEETCVAKAKLPVAKSNAEKAKEKMPAAGRLSVTEEHAAPKPKVARPPSAEHRVPQAKEAAAVPAAKKVKPVVPRMTLPVPTVPRMTLPVPTGPRVPAALKAAVASAKSSAGSSSPRMRPGSPTFSPRGSVGSPRASPTSPLSPCSPRSPSSFSQPKAPTRTTSLRHVPQMNTSFTALRRNRSPPRAARATGI